MNTTSAFHPRLAARMLMSFFTALALSGTPGIADGLLGHGGGSRPKQKDNCIPAEQRAAIRSSIDSFTLARPSALPPPSGLKKYSFFPQAGQFWGDLFPVNFVDLDPTSPGVLDFHGTGQTYDGHQGIDSDLVTFTEQSIGVPIFAAVDGTVVAAHDGEFDSNTVWMDGAQANFVVLNHGGTQETWYYHMKKNSVLVTAGQSVKAGQQLGLTASSGYSTGPHLHFESRNAGTFFEAFTGPSNPGTSNWVSQPTFRTDMYVRDFNITTDDLSVWAGPPVDTTRTGAVGRGTQTRSFWSVVQNLPANSTYRFRFLRPDGSVRFDSGTTDFETGGNGAYSWSYWYWYWSLGYNVSGTWTVELSINGQVVVLAPLEASNSAVANRPPLAVTASLDPPVAYQDNVVFCRVPHHVIDDPDYNVVRYKYEWRRNGQIVRTSTNASLADALVSGACAGGDALSCTVTPSDGLLSAAPVTVNLTVRQRFSEWAAAHGLVTDSYDADPKGDGLRNLVKYALGLSPDTYSTLPAPVRAVSGESSWTLPRNAALDPLVTFVVESSTDLKSWSDATPDANHAVWTAGSTADTRRFFRVKVVAPAS